MFASGKIKDCFRLGSMKRAAVDANSKSSSTRSTNHIITEEQINWNFMNAN
jgi:hypothetical protein